MKPVRVVVVVGELTVEICKVGREHIEDKEKAFGC